jgi:hypothetical protein
LEFAMNKRLATVLAAASALSLAGATWLIGSPAPAAPKGGTTITLDVHFSGFFLLDFSATGVKTVTSFQDPFDPSTGDQVVFRDELLRHGKVVGHDGGTCTVTEFIPTDADPIKLTCQVTFELPEGSIATQGLATNNPVKPLVITGGTGRYVGAAGDTVLTEFGDETGSVVFHLARR